MNVLHNLTFLSFQASGNKVSRLTVLCGSQNIVLHGKVIVQSDAIIRGDLANVRTGRYCIISKNAVIRPPFKKFSKGWVKFLIIFMCVAYCTIYYLVTSKTVNINLIFEHIKMLSRLYQMSCIIASNQFKLWKHINRVMYDYKLINPLLGLPFSL